MRKAKLLPPDSTLCPMCSRGDHVRHSVDYMDVEGRIRLCRCSHCVQLPFRGDVLAAQNKRRKA